MTAEEVTVKPTGPLTRRATSASAGMALSSVVAIFVASKDRSRREGRQCKAFLFARSHADVGLEAGASSRWAPARSGARPQAHIRPSPTRGGGELRGPPGPAWASLGPDHDTLLGSRTVSVDRSGQLGLRSKWKAAGAGRVAGCAARYLPQNSRTRTGCHTVLTVKSS